MACALCRLLLLFGHPQTIHGTLERLLRLSKYLCAALRELSLGAPYGLLDATYVNVGASFGSIGDDRDPIALNVGKATGCGNELDVAVFVLDFDGTCGERCDERSMVHEDAHRTHRAGQTDRSYGGVEDNPIRRHDLQAEGWHGVCSGCERPGLLNGLVNVSDHVEGLFGKVVVLALNDFFERPDGLGQRHVLAFDAGELRRHPERLR